jgi:transcription antitermination factor NusG
MNSENKDLNFIDIENWYAVYTKPRSEKKLDALLKKFSIEAYLPLLKLKKKWSDRTKIISMPLFTSYIFVRIVYRESYLKVLNITHAVGFVKSYGNPAIIPESEIEIIKSALIKLTNSLS